MMKHEHVMPASNGGNNTTIARALKRGCWYCARAKKLEHKTRVMLESRDHLLTRNSPFATFNAA